MPWRRKLRVVTAAAAALIAATFVGENLIGNNQVDTNDAAQTAFTAGGPGTPNVVGNAEVSDFANPPLGVKLYGEPVEGWHHNPVESHGVVTVTNTGNEVNNHETGATCYESPNSTITYCNTATNGTNKQNISVTNDGTFVTSGEHSNVAVTGHNRVTVDNHNNFQFPSVARPYY